jgi:hypothetical protein
MVPPVKISAPPLRIPAGIPARALPSAFKALLMPLKPRPPLPTLPTLARPAEKPVISDPKTKTFAVEEDKPRPSPKRTAEAAPDLLDPTTRLAAQLAPPLASSSVPAPLHTSSRARVSLEELVPQVLRRIAWGGDRQKGSVHLELTSGDEVTVHAEGRRVRVEVLGNTDLERRIGSRLRAAGIEVEGVG